MIGSDFVSPPGPGANAVAVSHAPLDRHLMGQYLEGCIKAAEARLAKATDKKKKEEAVREIERLVGRVVGEAGRLVTPGGVEKGKGEWGI